MGWIIVLLAVIIFILMIKLLVVRHTLAFYRKRCDNLLNAHAKRIDDLRNFTMQGFTQAGSAVAGLRQIADDINKYLRDIKAVGEKIELSQKEGKPG